MGWLNASEKQDALWPAFLHCNAIVNDSRWSLQRLRHLPFIVLWTRDHLGIYKWDKKLAIIITKLATWSRSLFRFKDGVWFNSYFSLVLTQFTELMETADHFTPDGDNTCQKLSKRKSSLKTLKPMFLISPRDTFLGSIRRFCYHFLLSFYKVLHLLVRWRKHGWIWTLHRRWTTIF